MSRGPRLTRRASTLLTFGGLVVASMLLVGASLALVSVWVTGWRLAPPAWPAWTNVLAVAAVASSNLLFGALVAFLAAALLKRAHAAAERNPPYSSPGLPARFARMGAPEFESEMAAVLQDRGYAVEPAPRRGSAPGVDLLLKKGTCTIAVQLKRWSAPVGDRSVQALFGGRLHLGADEAWLIATSRFTPKARQLARTSGVRLVDGTELVTWLEGGSDTNLKA